MASLSRNISSARAGESHIKLENLTPTQIQNIDYWTLRARSSQLFNENLYARGLLRRLITNEINTGLTPECCPDEEIIGAARF